jgi:oligoribonuclease NrnB/cAMP/cGMP phosphodiesterase (DHH superfamily)
MSYERIVTHGDFDGIVSAAICSYAFGCERIIFTGPNAIDRAEISIDARDIVCDLPYPLECGLWFDHHPGNLESLRLRGIDPDTIPGRFEGKPSCARVVFEYLAERGEELPAHFPEAVTEADTIDSFDYVSIEEWRTETPGKLVDMSLKAYFATPRDQTKYLYKLTGLVRDLPLPEVLEDPEVTANLERYRIEELRMLEFIRESASFMKEDTDHELILLDFTHHKRHPRMVKNLAYLLHPDAMGVLTLNPVFRGGRKTNDFAVSMSLSMKMTGRRHGKDIGEIMRSLNIGDGHVGAAAGMVHSSNKNEMLRLKRVLVDDIWKLWRSMPAGEAV